MYTPLNPIRPADDPQATNVHAVMDQLESLRTVIAVVARIAGAGEGRPAQTLGAHADLASAIANLPPGYLGALTRDGDSLARALRAGLIALDHARAAGRLNRASADLLWREASEDYAAMLAKVSALPAG